MRARRTVRGWYLVVRRRYLKVVWLRPGVVAIRCGIRQWQVGRLLVRVSRTLSAADRQS